MCAKESCLLGQNSINLLGLFFRLLILVVFPGTEDGRSVENNSLHGANRAAIEIA